MKHCLIRILSCMSLLFVMACTNNVPLDSVTSSEGGASLVLSIDSRSVNLGNGDVESGGKMRNLLVLLVDQHNIIVDGQLLDQLPITGITTQSITFEGLELGVYTLYAYANKDGLKFKKGGTFSETDQTIAVLSGTDTPQMKGNESFLTAKQEVSIKVGENQTKLEMLRTVAKLRMKIFNHSTSDIYVTDLTFGKFNASTAYLFSHDGDVPSTNTYRSLPAYALAGEDRRIVKKRNKEVYATCLYESKADGQYMFDLGLGIIGMTTEEYVLEPSAVNTQDVFTISTTVDNNNYYLYNNNGKLDVMELNNIEAATLSNDYLWTFEKVIGKKSYYIKNTSSNQYICVESNGSISYKTLAQYEAPYGGKFNLGTDTHSWLHCNQKASGSEETYAIDLNSDLNLVATIADSHSQWYFHKRIKHTKPSPEEGIVLVKSVKNQTIVTVDRHTAHVAPLSAIRRNQDIGIILNVYYNDKNDQFDFSVTPWEKHDEEVEFN